MRVDARYVVGRKTLVLVFTFRDCEYEDTAFTAPPSIAPRGGAALARWRRAVLLSHRGGGSCGGKGGG